jgi:hypothetical protein
MFTGIVTDIGEVIAIHARADNRRLKIVATMIAPARTAPRLPQRRLPRSRCRRRSYVVCGGRRAETPPLPRRATGAMARGSISNALKIGDELAAIRRVGTDGIAELIGRDDPITWPACIPSAAATRVSSPPRARLRSTVSLTVNEAEGDRFAALIIPTRSR